MKDLDLALLVRDRYLLHDVDDEPLERNGCVREMYAVQLLEHLFEAIDERVMAQHAYCLLGVDLFKVHVALAPDLCPQLWGEGLVEGQGCAVDACARRVSQHEAEVGGHAALRREKDT